MEGKDGKMYLYLIAGRNQIFLIGEGGGDDWAHQLTALEIENFPFDIFWSGGENNFEANSQKATDLSKS